MIFSCSHTLLGPTTFFALKPLTQSAISRCLSGIAIEADNLAFCPRDQIITISTLACARQLLTNCRRARLSFAVRQSRAQFPKLRLHRMRTCGALALRSPSSWIPVLAMAAANL
eukprot:6187719-Pleurochrysis_carterae.AAC.1